MIASALAVLGFHALRLSVALLVVATLGADGNPFHVMTSVALGVAAGDMVAAYSVSASGLRFIFGDARAARFLRWYAADALKRAEEHEARASSRESR